jgi:glycosyltransferase involved in cell wall biosynthesis
LQAHGSALAKIFQSVQAGESVSLAAIEYHTFVCAFLRAKKGELAKALQLLRTFFALHNDSKDLVHLYRVLLLTPPSRFRDAKFHESPPPEEGTPLISVVIPLYNQGRYLEEAVRSVRNQTQTRWEMVIVNDGSTDQSLPIAKKILGELRDPRIRLVSQPNKGKGATRNRGVGETTAPFICVLDADDMVCPAYFASALRILENSPDIGWVCPQTLVFGGNNHLTWTWEYDFFASLLKCPAPSSAVYRRAVWEEVRGYDEDMITSEDYVFWIKAGEKGWRGKTTEDVLFVYRHAFSRYGCRRKINILRKQQYIAKHPWWYRRLSVREMLPYLDRYPVVLFPENLLNNAAVERVRPFYGNKESFRTAVDDIRKEHPA